MKSNDLSYIAGFLDADGCIMASLESHSELKFGYRIRVVVKFSQHKRERGILEWIRQILQVGYISESRNEAELVIKDRESLKKLLKILTPYIRSKKKQLMLAVKILDSHPIENYKGLLKMAHMADAIGEANIRSKGRRKNTARKILLNHLINPATTDPTIFGR